MADIQDWVFFHGWEILVIGKLLSLFFISRFIGILSSERRPFINIYLYRKGTINKELLISLTIFLLGIIIVGKPKAQNQFSFELDLLLISFFGQLIFYGTEAIIILVLNEYLPLKRKNWHLQVVLFSLFSYIIHQNIFLYGENWSSFIVFFFILLFYTLKLRGELGWINPFITIALLIVPLSTIFGLDPIWGSRFSPFIFTQSVTGLEIGVFTLITLIYFKRRKPFLEA